MDRAPATDLLDLVPQSGVSGAARSRRRLAGDRIRVLSVNTHRGKGPKLRYLLENAAPSERDRILLLHDTRAYAYHIADWLHRQGDRYHVVALQEVFHGLLGGLIRRLAGRMPQGAYYRTLGGYPLSFSHRVGFSAFEYENVLLSRLSRGDETLVHESLPGRVFRLAACGFTLAPLRLGEHTVWVGNTHLHAYNPRSRIRQAESIARQIRVLGDVPVVFLGDLNTVPPGCKDGDFPHGDRDVRSYRGDRTLDVLADAGLTTIRHADREGFWTYPTGCPNRTLDYILFSKHWEVERYRVVREFTLSDHYPVESELRLADA